MLPIILALIFCYIAAEITQIFVCGGFFKGTININKLNIDSHGGTMDDFSFDNKGGIFIFKNSLPLLFKYHVSKVSLDDTMADDPFSVKGVIPRWSKLHNQIEKQLCKQ